MWTVTVTLPDGSTETYADDDRRNPVEGTSAWTYSYEVDQGTEALRIYRATLQYGEHDDDYRRYWKETSAATEVAYYKPHQWDRVRGE